VAFVEAFRDQFGVEPICRALRQAGVAISPSGYYAARARPPPARAVRDAALEKQILRVCKDSGERYGAWKVRDQLNREGIAAARCTVERLMRALGLRGVRRGGWKKPRTTVADPSQPRPADLVNRGFAPPAPDRLWVVDFTFVATWAGTAYTALVIDAFARLIAGWRTAARHDTGLVLDALVMAVTCRARQGVKVAGLIHHSDYAEVGVKPGNRGLACSGGLADGFFGLTLRWCVVSVRRVLTSVEGDGYGCDGHTDRRGRRRGAARGRLHGVDDRSVCKDDQGAGSVCRGAGRRL